MHGDARGAFSQLFIRITEPIVFGKRPRTLMVVALLTLFFGYNASQIRPDAGFEKQLPLDHPYMKVFQQYQKDFGGANLVLFAAIQKQGDIYNEKYLNTLKRLTDEVFFLPGIDRSRVSSMFTPDTRYIEVVEGGFSGGNVIPADYKPSPEMFAQVRRNVGKADIIGRMVTNSQNGAMVFSELLDADPVTGEKLDYTQVSDGMEQIRNRFTSPVMYEYRVKSDQGEFKAGDVVARRFVADHSLLHSILPKGIDVIKEDQDFKKIVTHFSGWSLDVTEAPNPDYNADVDIHIVGFAKVVGDVTDATFEVVSFFGLTLFLTMILLWIYCGSLRIAVIPLSCSLLAVVWELGLLHLFGFGLDPFAILVPFLVLSIAVSHGVQITSFWLYEVSDHGLDSFAASRATYRRLVIPGISAVLTNVVGFGTILLVPIGIVREMAINAMFGLMAIIVCKKVLLPCLLSYATLPNPEKFREHQRRRDEFFAPVWRAISVITQKNVAVAVLIGAVLLAGWAAYMRKDLKIGELHAGVPELRPDSRYNLDSAAVTRNFAIGVDILKVIAETHEDGCIDHEVMETIDAYSATMANTTGVQSVLSLESMAKIVAEAYNEGNPRWKVLPHNKNTLVTAITPIPPSSGLMNPNCSAVPVLIFTKDHTAESISSIVAATDKFNAELDSDSPVHFKLATGNVGVMAATNDVIKDTEHTVLFWLFLCIGICVWLSFRSIASLICVLLPLWMVSVITYAVMVFLDIGLKVSTLPVAAFAAGIGVDYGIYIFSVLEECVGKGMTLRKAYEQTLHQTGKAVLFTALTLAASVCTWMLSGLQFQVDMGILLTIMFVANAVAAVLLLPAFAAFLLKRPAEAETGVQA